MDSDLENVKLLLKDRSIDPNEFFGCGDLQEIFKSKQQIITEIEADFNRGLEGIFRLPATAKFGVYTAYKYYLRLLIKLKKTPSMKIKSARVRVPNYQKMDVLARSYVRYQLNIL